MRTNRSNRARRPARRTPFLEPKPIILVVCEGDATEPDYLNGFAKLHHNSRVRLKIAPEHGRDPKTLVEIAKGYKKDAEKRAKKEGDDNIAFDEVWCVFDVDSFDNIPDAVQQARDNDLKIAISNPNIEVWLLFHFEDHTAIRDRVYVRARLKKFLPDYDKHVNFLRDFAANYDVAVKRCVKQDEFARNAGRKPYEHNPSSGFYQLTESIRVN